MNHELASILLTETIQYSLYVSKKPVYAIFLDAKSAFDRVIKEILMRNLYFAGTDDHRLLFINNRLSSRHTYCEFDKILMGPIIDSRGLEQGGISSSDLYKLYNNEQAEAAQKSQLGVQLDLCSRNIVSCISLADDAVLVANEIVDLQNLIYLTELYCKKYGVELVIDKTKLIAFSVKNDTNVAYVQNTATIRLNNAEIPFCDEVVHLGVLRSSGAGNSASVMDRISAYRKQLFSLLPAGLASHHQGNPTVSLKIEKIYCLPVFLSGISTLVLNKSEISLLDKFRKNTLSRLMKLPDTTPDSFVYFLAGSLSTTGFIDLRQMSLFAMICNLEENILKDHAKNILITSNKSSKSWFFVLSEICQIYGLPHPLEMLEKPLSRHTYKKLCWSKVHDYWRAFLCNDTLKRSSLSLVHTPFMSLVVPHPIWTTLDGNPYQTRAAAVQALLLSGRYRTERLRRFWTPENREGFCLQSECFNLKKLEDVRHILLLCSAYNCERRRLFALATKSAQNFPLRKPILDEYLFNCSDVKIQLQFLLDCSSLPLVVTARQLFGDHTLQHLFKFTRTWCFMIHKKRMTSLGRPI